MTNAHEVIGESVNTDKAWIQLYSGGIIHLLKPQPEEIHIVDIAHALSQMCRFTGHTRTFYSVAEHLYFASFLAEPQDALWGLMHDASESYCADLNRPLKHYTAIGPVYREVEERIQNAICDRYGLPREMPKSVHEADIRMLYTEKEQLLPRMAWVTKWSVDERPANIVLPTWKPRKAEKMFLKRFKELYKGE